MYNCCTNYLATLPDIPIYINCDTVVAVNLQALNLGDFDEFVFTIKNYDYKDAPYIFIFKARKNDADKNGEVVFKIPRLASRRLNHGAFYALAIFTNAHDTKNETIYTSYSERGNIILEHGRQDLSVRTDDDYEIISMRLEPLDTPSASNTIEPTAEIVGLRLEPI